MQAKPRDGKRTGARRGLGQPSAVDVHVGARLRLRRAHLGMSQEKLGDAVGLTFQQIQKYERGANRIGASRLFDLSRVLDVPVQFFFDDMARETAAARQGPARADGEAKADQPVAEPAISREGLELVSAYHRIADSGVRRRLLDLAIALADFARPAKAP
jgi:transcriptional regulator with XRE-family HTH domain